MNVIEFLKVKLFQVNAFGMLRGLPKFALTVFLRIFTKSLTKGEWQVCVGVIEQLPPSEFSKIIKRMLQSVIVKILVKYNCMHMIWHDNVRIYAQPFIPDGEIQTLSDDFAGRLFDKYRHPFHNGECHEIDSNALDNSVSFHKCYSQFMSGNLRLTLLDDGQETIVF